MEIYTELRRQTPKVTGSLLKMREETFKDGAVPGKYKVLAALVTVIVTKCDPCITAYTKMAIESGVTLEELIEFLNVAITEGGCPGEEWAMKAYKVYLDLRAGVEAAGEACCR